MQLIQIKRLVVILLYLIISIAIIYAQKENILVTGTMTDSEGEAIPGLSVTIEGTTEGTITDVEGNYQIEVPLGSTLVFSFIGMKTKKAIVTRTGLNPVGSRMIIPFNHIKEDTRFVREEERKALNDSAKVADRYKFYREYLSDSAIIESYDRINTTALEISSSRIERQIKRYSNLYSEKNYRLGKIVVKSNFAFDRVARLPELQSKYGQGRPLNGMLSYQGPSTGEMFSWGPPLVNLEYDGVATSDDIKGSLVAKGEGNGDSSIAYDPTNIFKTGFTNSYDIVSYHTLGSAHMDFGYRYLLNSGVLPGEDIQSHRFNIKLDWDDRIKANVVYQTSKDNFRDGIMKSRILSATYLTPVSFDNSFGLSAKDAQRDQSVIYHPDGSIRSASPAHFDNPYLFVQKGVDRNEHQSLLYNVNFEENWSMGHIHADFSGQYSENRRELKFPEGSVGNLGGINSNRNDKTVNYFAGAFVENYLFGYQFRFNVPIRAEFYNYSRGLAGSNFEFVDNKKVRNIFTANPTLQYSRNYDDILVAKAGLNIYASSTSDKVCYRPNFGVSFSPFIWFDNTFYWDTQNVFQSFKLKLDYITQVNEYILDYKSGLNNSLAYNVADFNRYFENQEINVYSTIQPEIVSKLDFSITSSFINGALQSTTSFYWNRRRNSIFPVINNDELVFENLGDIKVNGLEETLSARLLDNSFKWDVSLTMSQIKSKVSKSNYEAPVALAGFADVHTTFVQDQNPGVIMGSSWLRNSEGKKVVGNDGFPLVDVSPSVLGDPNPDFFTGLSNEFSLNGMEFGFTLDAVVGGDVWNGTQATLDYYGVSQKTADEREVRNYIFDGVNQNGEVNNKLVSFAPDNGSVENNRWVRYVVSGVAEDYIQDGSRLVLKELYFTYNFNVNTVKRWGLENLSITAVANNLVTLSRYKGNLASNTLWGHSNTMGLDYFNSPQIRRYGLTLQVTF
nr:carboxypeptidase-like regulatory domain-containing protein [uncultured Carboxylicivirga sp.]